ncbi:hypothetical protein JOD62_000392 [Microbacterium keratanolyticum]|uniref:CueP family metal-binding protein n=1 Tax=Microbacterium keratanolyticum TaxID=67574 RepID=A0A9W6HVQ2_9MICO|nr:CueP family metal-binding protein [Microbacterium keratanolyticum]MBM7467844.1 hypothetical protein [Microbacterium keratanolyticum]GLK02835.1 hypothetical protein GCM10017596_25500 [Microbacterium keratanolyticum]
MRSAARRSALPALIATAALLLAGCAAPSIQPKTPDATAPSTAAVEQVDAAELLAPLGLDGQDARSVIDALEALPVDERPSDLIASIRTEELLLKSADGREASLPMPADVFYTSVAPYVTQTHDCFYHSLTTCRGELSSTPLAVTIIAADGTVIVDETVTTNDNGFAGFWLPRDLDATITITQDGRTVTAPLSTTDEDATCVTTLQLT